MSEPASMHRRPTGVAFALRLAVALATVLSVAGCGNLPIRPDGPVEATARDNEFVLVIHVDRGSYGAHEPIGARATLTYIGPQPAIEARGSGSGPILFAIDQLDGPLDNGGWTDDCATHPFLRGVAQTRPFAKSGGFDPQGPDAAFWRAYFGDALLRLPAGRWEIVASIELGIGDCAEPWHRLKAAAEIEIRP